MKDWRVIINSLLHRSVRIRILKHKKHTVRNEIIVGTVITLCLFKLKSAQDTKEFELAGIGSF